MVLLIGLNQLDKLLSTVYNLKIKLRNAYFL